MLFVVACLFAGLFYYCLVSLFFGSLVFSFFRSFVRCLLVCVLVCMLVCFLPVRLFSIRSFVCLFVCRLLSSCRISLWEVLWGVTRNRIYEKMGGKGKEVGRQIGHHRTAKHKEPKEATGVQI